MWGTEDPENVLQNSVAAKSNIYRLQLCGAGAGRDRDHFPALALIQNVLMAPGLWVSTTALHSLTEYLILNYGN